MYLKFFLFISHLKTPLREKNKQKKPRKKHANYWVLLTKLLQGVFSEYTEHLIQASESPGMLDKMRILGFCLTARESECVAGPKYLHFLFF